MLTPNSWKVGVERGSFYIHISWKVNVLWRVRFTAETFVPFFMKSGTKKCRGEEALDWPCRTCRANFNHWIHWSGGAYPEKHWKEFGVFCVGAKRPFCVFCGKKGGWGAAVFTFTFHEKWMWGEIEFLTTLTNLINCKLLNESEGKRRR